MSFFKILFDISSKYYQMHVDNIQGNHEKQTRKLWEIGKWQKIYGKCNPLFAIDIGNVIGFMKVVYFVSYIQN